MGNYFYIEKIRPDYMDYSIYSPLQEKAMARYTWFLWLSSSQWKMLLTADAGTPLDMSCPVRLLMTMHITASALLRYSSLW